MSRVARLAAPVLAVIARRYVAGPRLEDAISLAARVGRPVTLAYWDAADESPATVAHAYARTAAALRETPVDGYVSVKLPSLRRDPEAIERTVASARDTVTMLHFDSLAEAWAEETVALACSLPPEGLGVGATLPGAWSRSVADAKRLAEAGVRVRVVKGQWPGDADPSAGFLDVVDALAAVGAPAVAVATHDAALARRSLERLAGAVGALELELLHGLALSALRTGGRGAGNRDSPLHPLRARLPSLRREAGPAQAPHRVVAPA